MSEAGIVHIVDDDASLRLALDSLFRSVQLGTRQYGSAQEFFAAERPEVASCLVLDIRLPGMSGLDFQQQLRQGGVLIPVILMTGHGDIPMTVRGMKAGAIDFLTKPFRDQDMLDAVGSALEKDRARRAADGDSARLRAVYETLSAREREVMSLVVAGRLNKQIAGDLNLAEITVKIHRGAAMKKMGARSLADLVRMAEALHLEPAKVSR
jgi:FixJ family two-component response regulator